MAPVQSCPDMPSSEHETALKKTFSPYHQGLTPPNSPTEGTATSQVTVKYLKHLFGMFLEKALLNFTNEELPYTPVTQDRSPPGPDMVRLNQLLVKLTRDECASAELSVTTKPAQSCSASNGQEENVQEADEINLKCPIYTTPSDFKSFEKWASTPQFKTVLETYEPPTRPFIFWKLLTKGLAGTKKHANTKLPSQRRLAMT